MFGAYDLVGESFYYKSAKRANSVTFIQFLHQLRQRFPGTQLHLILDNASYHKSKKVNAFLERYPEVRLHFLLPYSPEYNPTEQVWRWLKPRLHGASIITGGINELLGRLRRYMWHWREGRLANPLSVGVGIWDKLPINLFAG